MTGNDPPPGEPLRALVELAGALAEAVTPRDTARAAAAGARRALVGSFAAVSVWEPERGRLRVLVNDGERAPGEEEFPSDESYPLRAFPDPASPGGPWTATEDSPGPRGDRLRRRGRGSCLVAPVLVHGRAWGELYVARPRGAAAFTPYDAAFAAAVSAVVAAGLAQTERLEEARRLAFTDPLTGLANRRALDLRLDEAVARHRADGTVVSLVVCDVNGLKEVNDSFGHARGDRLLERFGALLSLHGAALGDTLAARLGGDEFCLLAAGPPADDVVRTAAELCARAADLEPGRGVACGVASTGDPIGPVPSGRRLLRLADAAQYAAKAAGAAGPVVAGRDREVTHLADHPPRGRSRRAFRGRPRGRGDR
ncbi:GGDEF domain-containing protein [Streptomyces sp. WMMC500]|uniref:GGDEF domain-containing protein n=1 Tax=Streptomyces sp. WMMC500 TaxID=3015154 RepID=UPI00248AFB7A|nr:GGDEF domain-containing protein [Streptomyces sp. WMMC500]WBB63519.1 GGDEF domain-containing protein [Streptomyces sp. WMMC500]